MGTIPGFLLRHRVQVEPYLAAGPFGDTFGPSIEVRCFLDEGRRKVRGKDGAEIVSEATFYARRDTNCPEGSRVTLPSGRVCTALVVLDRNGGGLPTPDHVEVALT
jgi:hypothetical protein